MGIIQVSLGVTTVPGPRATLQILVVCSVFCSHLFLLGRGPGVHLCVISLALAVECIPPSVRAIICSLTCQWVFGLFPTWACYGSGCCEFS